MSYDYGAKQSANYAGAVQAVPDSRELERVISRLETIRDLIGHHGDTLNGIRSRAGVSYPDMPPSTEPGRGLVGATLEQGALQRLHVLLEAAEQALNRNNREICALASFV